MPNSSQVLGIGMMIFSAHYDLDFGVIGGFVFVVAGWVGSMFPREYP